MFHAPGGRQDPRSPWRLASSSTRCWASCCTRCDMELFPIPKSRSVLSVNLRSSRHFFSFLVMIPGGGDGGGSSACPGAVLGSQPTRGAVGCYRRDIPGVHSILERLRIPEQSGKPAVMASRN